MSKTPQRLQVQGLTVTYGAATTVLNGLDLTLDAGDVRVVLGPNGAGKSTLFNAITGAVPAISGSIRVGETDLIGMPPHLRARRFVRRSFQTPKLSNELSAREHLMLAGQSKAADALGVTQFGDLAVARLTHAERKMLEIATTLALETPILLLDEPSAGLDAASKTRLLDNLPALRESASTLIIEHDLDFIERLNAPVLLLTEGRIMQEGSIAQVGQFARARGMYF